jgi:hypothetical protein
LVYGLVKNGGDGKKMVKVNSTYSIDHEIKINFQKMIGRNTSNDLEAYMKSRLEEAENIKNIVAPYQGTTDLNSESASFNSDSNLKSVTIKQEKITLDVLNMSKAELSVTIDKIGDLQTMGKVQANAHMVEGIAKTRMKKLRQENV